jgi:hypothetical protein
LLQNQSSATNVSAYHDVNSSKDALVAAALMIEKSGGDPLGIMDKQTNVAASGPLTFGIGHTINLPKDADAQSVDFYLAHPTNQIALAGELLGLTNKGFNPIGKSGQLPNVPVSIDKSVYDRYIERLRSDLPADARWRALIGVKLLGESNVQNKEFHVLATYMPETQGRTWMNSITNFLSPVGQPTNVPTKDRHWSKDEFVQFCAETEYQLASLAKSSGVITSTGNHSESTLVIRTPDGRIYRAPNSIPTQALVDRASAFKMSFHQGVADHYAE